jgi:hypothetical protein
MSRTKESKTQTDPEVRSSYPLDGLSIAVLAISATSLMTAVSFYLMGSSLVAAQ